MSDDVVRRLICCVCRKEVISTARLAAFHGWDVYVGGAVCTPCSLKLLAGGGA
jgi:hypothetical protein